MKVKEIMTKNVISIRDTLPIKDAVIILRRNKISGAPVLDESGKVVGVFSESNILDKLPDILEEADKIPMVDVQELTSPPVSTVMGKPPIVVRSDEDIRNVAKIFLEKYIHRVPVVDDDKLVGIISLGDVLKAFSEVKLC
ncbi:CBS domain-containing protein [Deferribacteraceae bacterium V6Fe1]|nr:CBS domain-containing protein [Deferribacteraceae bacterium V6Fe1]